MAARGNVPSASENSKNAAKDNTNLEALNANQSNPEEFGYLQTILEIKTIFDLVPALLTEMKKSFKSQNPADKLGHLLKGVCSSISNISVNDV
ncbi:hypothetical protein TNCT_328211 [Trichonephila clavata]|uniref:Uncharacterized protein n=1 Tax=Trichonephila clavata TaxID=2740835 RepID=A0A8X6M1M4_TRICU|nr:hypothetical protein TNCT_328211 [Trichonephila clavata]